MNDNAPYHPGNIFMVARVPMRDDKNRPITCYLDYRGRWYILHQDIRHETIDIWSTCYYLNMVGATIEA